jgi:hypothetical protein
LGSGMLDVSLCAVSAFVFGGQNRTYQVTMACWPTVHTVDASGLVICGSTTMRLTSGAAWAKTKQ